MIEVFTPFLMILLTWNDGDPDATMKIGHSVYIDKATCERAGRERIALIEKDREARLERFKVEQIRTEDAKFFCVPRRSEIEKYRPLLDES